MAPTLEQPAVILSAKFMYDGKSRIVDNFVLEGQQILGYEVRKSGRFSMKIKRYSLAKITGDITMLDPASLRRPNRPEIL